MKIKPDHKAEVADDLLGRNNIASEIVRSLIGYSQKNKDGMAISITGEWGSGKSTLLGFIEDQIRNNYSDIFKIISFNPWLFYKNEGIKEAFLIHLGLSLKDLDTKTAKISEKVNDFLKAFRWLKYLSATAGNIQEGLEDLSKHLGKNENVHDIKEDIEIILRKSRKKILVLIDDTDRLSSDQITELFQTITLVTNFSNIIYIVAFDREMVIDAIGKHFNGKGQEYLEKVIQVDYEIPYIPDQKLQEFFNSGISEIGKDYKIQFDEVSLKSLWGYQGMKEYFKSIRDFKRFFNALSFRLPSIAADIYPTDFAAIEAIRIFDYPSYIKFYTAYKTNARKRELPESGLTQDQFDYLKPTAVEIIRALTPEKAYYHQRKDANLKRLLDPDYFDRYFNLMRNDNDISEKDLSIVITSTSSFRRRILAHALQFNWIENMIARLGDTSIHKIYPVYDYSLIHDLIDFFNRNSNLFQHYCNRVSNMLINLICGNKKNKRQFIQTFFQSFGRNIQPPSIVHIYYFHYIRMFIKDGRNFRIGYQLFDEYYKTNYAFIEKSYMPNFRAAANFMWESSQTLSCPFIKYLYQINYAQLFPTEYQEILNSFSHDKIYLLYLAEQYVKIDEDTLQLHRYNWIFRDDVFPEETFVKFYNQIKSIEPETLTEHQKAIRKHLLALDITNYPDIKYPSEPQMIMI